MFLNEDKVLTLISMHMDIQPSVHYCYVTSHKQQKANDRRGEYNSLLLRSSNFQTFKNEFPVCFSKAWRWRAGCKEPDCRSEVATGRKWPGCGCCHYSWCGLWKSTQLHMDWNWTGLWVWEQLLRPAWLWLPEGRLQRAPGKVQYRDYSLFTVTAKSQQLHTQWTLAPSEYPCMMTHAT